MNGLENRRMGGFFALSIWFVVCGMPAWMISVMIFEKQKLCLDFWKLSAQPLCGKFFSKIDRLKYWQYVKFDLESLSGALPRGCWILIRSRIDTLAWNLLMFSKSFVSLISVMVFENVCVLWILIMFRILNFGLYDYDFRFRDFGNFAYDFWNSDFGLLLIILQNSDIKDFACGLRFWILVMVSCYVVGGYACDMIFRIVKLKGFTCVLRFGILEILVMFYELEILKTMLVFFNFKILKNLVGYLVFCAAFGFCFCNYIYALPQKLLMTILQFWDLIIALWQCLHKWFWLSFFEIACVNDFDCVVNF